MTVAWRPNPTAPLWYEERRGEPVGPFFHDLSLQHTKQVGRRASPRRCRWWPMRRGRTTPEEFKARTNSQALHTWSQALALRLQLAYCTRREETRVFLTNRRLRRPVLLCFYSETRLRPTTREIVHGSHHHAARRHHLRHGQAGSLRCVQGRGLRQTERQTKRIFRVVPLYHPGI